MSPAGEPPDCMRCPYVHPNPWPNCTPMPPEPLRCRKCGERGDAILMSARILHHAIFVDGQSNVAPLPDPFICPNGGAHDFSTVTKEDGV